MRAVIASDLHGSSESLLFLLKKVEEQKPDLVILLGDLLYHGPRNPIPGHYGPMDMPEMFAALQKLVPITAVRGNCDAEIDVMLMPFPVMSNVMLELDGLRIFASHGHRIPERPPMPNFPQGTIFLRGHSHVPRAEELDGYFFWNPGSLTLPKPGYPRSWALYEKGIFSVYSIDGKLLCQNSPEK